MENHKSLEDMAANCCIVQDFLKDKTDIFESRFYPISEELLAQINKIVDSLDLDKLKIMKKLGRKEQKVGDIALDQNLPIYMGKFMTASFWGDRIVIPYGNLESIDEISEDEQVILDKIKDIKQEIKNQIQHEVEHAIDQKTKKNIIPKKYKNLVKKSWNDYTDLERASYVKEPIEFDAIGSQYAAFAKDKFKRGSAEQKVNIIQAYKNWLNGQYDELPFMEKDMVIRWKTKPTLYKRLKLRVYNLMKELESME